MVVVVVVVYVGILKQQASVFVQAALQGTPQYAYRKHTSTLGALRRASGHCRMVRHVLARQVDTAKLFNQPMRELVGGLMVSLDLSKAFDCLSYSEMYSSLLEVNVPESLAVAIMHLHHNTVLTIQHKGHSEQIGVQRGLRQGCGIAPIVYAAWTVKLRRQLDTALGQHWTAAHLSLFADDKHGFWAIEALRISIGTLHQHSEYQDADKLHKVVRASRSQRSGSAEDHAHQSASMEWSFLSHGADF